MGSTLVCGCLLGSKNFPGNLQVQQFHHAAIEFDGALALVFG